MAQLGAFRQEQTGPEHMSLAALGTEARLCLQNNLGSNMVGLTLKSSARRFSILFLNRAQARPC